MKAGGWGVWGENRGNQEAKVPHLLTEFSEAGCLRVLFLGEKAKGDALFLQWPWGWAVRGEC